MISSSNFSRLPHKIPVDILVVRVNLCGEIRSGKKISKIFLSLFGGVPKSATLL